MTSQKPKKNPSRKPSRSESAGELQQAGTEHSAKVVRDNPQRKFAYLPGGRIHFDPPRKNKLGVLAGIGLLALWVLLMSLLALAAKFGE